MAKNKPKQAQVAAPEPKVAEIITPQPTGKKYSLYDFKVQAVILGVIAFVFYFNSFFNEFAHDDGIVIVKNEYVQEGLSGIPKIMTRDAYDSYYRQLNTSNQLSGGRYRPLSIVTFAIEQQFMGTIDEDKIDSVLKENIAYGVKGKQEQQLIKAMHVRHVFNVLWYIASIAILLYFLRMVVFKNQPIIAFIAALIFTIHPIHTEVVANVKSRDEIMSLLFMCLTFIFAFRFEEKRKEMKWMLAGLVSYFLTFLSKEYALTTVVLLPMAFYTFRNFSFKRSVMTAFPYMVVAFIYVALRIYVLYFSNNDMEYQILNASILKRPGLADAVESLSQTALNAFPFLVGITALLCIFYYSLAEINDKTEGKVFKTNVILLLPFMFFAGLYLLVLVGAVPGLNSNAEKEVLNNPYIFAVGNQKLATEIATSLNYLKLLIFPHPLSADYSYNSIPYKDFSNVWVLLSLLVHGIIAAVAVMYSKKRHVLGFAAAFYLLHLMLVCNIFFEIGATMGERLIYHSSVGFAIAAAWLLWKGFEKIQPAAVGQKALAVVLGVIVVFAGIKTVARNAAWKNDGTLFLADLETVPNSVLVCANVAASYITLADGKSEQQRKDYLNKSIELLNHALSIHPDMVASYMNRGIAYYKLGDMDRAKANLDSVKHRYPSYPTLPGIYRLIADDYMKKGWSEYGSKGQYVEAVNVFKKGIAIDSTNPDLWYNLGGAYYSNMQYTEAIEAWRVSLQLKPDNVKAQQGMQAAMGMMSRQGQKQ
ncbi:MAG: bacteriophage receptor, outer rane subunit [Flavipsychrobacter sp.]|jgi:tetratricopeptide (TPR) repeat protein|nr:bacteriophage receptor, outer rane subunit [Flavipsychrobacter sp.]